jgi:16S rRNA (uracil1498-N3)-methyltransferase
VRRYWVPAEAIMQSVENGDFSGQVMLEGETFHHIFDVCRRQVGHHFEILNGSGQAYLVEVTEVKKKSAIAKIIESRKIADLPKPNINLALAVSRYPVVESLIEKMVELGVYKIHFFYSDYSFIRAGTEIPENKWERWKKIVISSTQQSGRGELMNLESPVPLSALLKNVGPKNALISYEGEEALPFTAGLNALDKTNQDIWIFVGSEGGFSEKEVSSFRTMGHMPLSLGSQVLRVETAAVSLVAICKQHLGHF